MKGVKQATEIGRIGKVSTHSKEPPAERLSESVIIQQALALVDEVGLDKLSMRRLAGRMECDPMAFYYYFPKKQDLLDGLAEHLEQLCGLPEQWNDWRDAIGQFGQNQLKIAIAHPNAVPAFAIHPSHNPTTLAYLDWIKDRLAEGNIRSMQALRTFVAGINGVLLYFHSRDLIGDKSAVRQSKLMMSTTLNALCIEFAGAS